MTAVAELIAFLRDQLDAEEQLALRLDARYRVRNPDRADDGEPYWPLPTVERRFLASDDDDVAAGLDLIKAYSPARVLAEVEAKRERIDWIEGELVDDPTDETAQWLAKLEAKPYAGRDGWREEWRA